MILDGHIHIYQGNIGKTNFVSRLKRARVEGGIVISLPPPSFTWVASNTSAKDRLENLFFWTRQGKYFFPFFWIDPVEKNALRQVDMAVKKGVAGFKIICNTFFPGDRRALRIIKAIAEREKPILFHSGILWDGSASSRYNRPVEFEALLDVIGLRFALAHISWPWCDELVAVYGKFQHALSVRRHQGVEMFIDITPGTPPLYREEALRKVFNTGYYVENNVIFGSDGVVFEYDYTWTQQWIKRDNAIYKKLNLPQRFLKKVYGENLKRFVQAKGE